MQLACFQQGENFFNGLNVKQIKCIEAKLAKPTQHIEALETKKKSCDSIFKGVHKQHKLVNQQKEEEKKENRRKSNERKRKRTMEPVLETR